jgi:hypothetical protein
VCLFSKQEDFDDEWIERNSIALKHTIPTVQTRKCFVAHTHTKNLGSSRPYQHLQDEGKSFLPVIIQLQKTKQMLGHSEKKSRGPLAHPLSIQAQVHYTSRMLELFDYNLR